VTSRVITFYSYKGGVGRSFALASVAVILAQWGARVLMVDWDIEAPGLNHYFKPHWRGSDKGVLDFLQDCQHDDIEDWSAYARPIEIPDLKGRLHLMPAAGNQAQNRPDYVSILQKLDWDALYDEHDLGGRLEILRERWLDEFDFVLLDSRTGITDFSGVTTVQLPDILVFLFTANEQSLEGCADIAARAMEARRNLPLDRSAILPLPVPSRIEQRDEYDQALRWKQRFEARLGPFLDIWTSAHTDRATLIDYLTIPYVPRWTFGEDVAPLYEEGGADGLRSPSQAASYACETIAATLALGLSRPELLTNSREEYVHLARSQFRNSIEVKPAALTLLVLGRASKDGQFLALLAAQLQAALGEPIDVQLADPERGRIMLEPEPVVAAFRRADACVVLFNEQNAHDERSFEYQIEWMMRENLRSPQPRALMPIVFPGGEAAFQRSRMADYLAVKVSSRSSQAVSVFSAAERLAKQLSLRRPINHRREDFLRDVEGGDRLNIIGGSWKRGSGFWQGSGPDEYLLSSNDYETPFSIQAQFQFGSRKHARAEERPMNAGIVFGWRQESGPPRYFNLLLSGRSIRLERIGFRGGNAYRDFEHLSGEAPLPIELGQALDFHIRVDEAVLTVDIDDRRVLALPILSAARGKVGLRPWRSAMRCTKFVVEGR
jgi:cellulose biosynthesis protein BcsQ